MKPRLAILALLAAAAVTALATLGQAGATTSARVQLTDADGDSVGRVDLRLLGGGLVLVTANLSGLPAGFHGFHIHAVGSCDETTTPPFTSAGGHHNPSGGSHPAHAGDMPVLLVTAQGVARAEFVTDRLKFSPLFDADGSAIIIHANPDNYANIPTRYVAAPDMDTLRTGDAGGRVACGVLEER